MKFPGYIFQQVSYRKDSKVYLDENGYYRFKDSNKLVHRWAAEKKLGRPFVQEKSFITLIVIRGTILTIIFRFSLPRKLMRNNIGKMH
jgi:hypothetical protein